jgi:CIC family chloride channel protein
LTFNKLGGLQLQRNLMTLLRRFQVNSDQTFLIITAVVVGIVVGGGTLLFEEALKASSRFFWVILPGWIGGGKLSLVLTPCLGGLLLAPMILLFPKDATKDGVPATMEAVALKSGFIKWTNSFLRMIMSAITLGSGGSAGSEGPIIQIGSALASGIGQFLRVSSNRLRVIVACGAAAGLASIFNAPIAGVLFALEVVMGEFNVHSFSPIVISSVVATGFSRAYLTHGEQLRVLPYQLTSLWEIALYGLMGVIAGLVSVGFIRSMHVVESFFEHRIRLPKAFKPALGGLCVGLLGLISPRIFGYSYGPILEAISGNLTLTTLVLLVGLKIIGTAFTLGSGGSGGILCPSLFLGAMTGAACGAVFNYLFPHLGVHPGAYAIVGMGALLGAAVQAPMTAIIMIFELTNVYTVILPMMTACIMASLVQQKILAGSIYTLSLARKGIDIEAGREMGILTSLEVKSIMEPRVCTIGANTPMGDIMMQCLTGGANYLYVVDGEGSLEGVISFSDLKEFVFEEHLKNLVLAKELSNRDVISVTPNESLASALNKFSLIDIDELPVVERMNGSTAIKGRITRSHLLKAYRLEMLKRSMIAERSPNPES